MSQPVAYHRSPCPGRIFEDLGVGFSIGVAGGSIFYFFKGSFGMWGGVFSSMDCLLIYYRQKDDPFNAIIAGFITGGVLAIRGGLNVAFKNAVIGGVFLALIEGVSTVVTSISMRRQYQMMEEMQKQEMERIQKQMRRGGTDPWAVDYNETLAKQAPPENEVLMDRAKSFSF
ncbi:mitochondrial import inner membrane translocase subunit [Stylonychia lemnae]|uniref:Mitochondrial import inner membrane translocase subunit n=1 Tax=Stylonychia lemnae TaxID=5949 RepID=A0A077ZWN6_STYLE|nr:mitochondrial import inner membrane translocase subunit [Stylonychia lemnae]|eukprot:CDW72901.1 mitochondrial import inner membrane translocase subunit [Stylonychia lemnae]